MIIQEAKKAEFLIANRDGTIVPVTGTILTDEFFARKIDDNYFKYGIVDVKSGALIALRLKTLAECKDFLENMPQEKRDNLAKVRQSEEYTELCKKIQQEQEKRANNDGMSFEEALNELDKINAKVDQIYLFDLV